MRTRVRVGGRLGEAHPAVAVVAIQPSELLMGDLGDDLGGIKDRGARGSIKVEVAVGDGDGTTADGWQVTPFVRVEDLQRSELRVCPLDAVACACACSMVTRC